MITEDRTVLKDFGATTDVAQLLMSYVKLSDYVTFQN